MKKYTPEEWLSAFWSKVDRPADSNACWIWTAHTVEGYGRVKINRRAFLAHRVSYKLAHGTFPKELYVLHSCDNPLCVNPAHLFLGTQTDNMRDMEKKGRGNQPRGEDHVWHKLSNRQVAEIRRLYAAGGITQKELGIRFGVSQTCIGGIVNYKHRR